MILYFSSILTFPLLLYYTTIQYKNNKSPRYNTQIINPLYYIYTIHFPPSLPSLTPRSFEWTLQPVVSTLLSIVFRSQRLDNLQKTLNISFTFDKYFQYKGHNVPCLLRPLISQVVQCAQNLNILELSDPLIFKLCLNPKVAFVFRDEAKVIFGECRNALLLIEGRMGSISGEIIKRLVGVTRR